MDGVVGDERIVFQFINDRERNVMFATSNRTFMPILKVKDSADEYIEKVLGTDCGRDDCDDMIFTINGLPSGRYIVEMIPIENDGEFKVEMMCSTQSLEDREGISQSQITPIFPHKFQISTSYLHHMKSQNASFVNIMDTENVVESLFGI